MKSRALTFRMTLGRSRRLPAAGNGGYRTPGLATSPFKHPRAVCWIQRAGSKWKVYVGSYEVPGGTRAHREQIARELTAVYRPSCNEQQYDHAWKDEWIGEYSAAPTTAPVTRRGPDQRPG